VLTFHALAATTGDSPPDLIAAILQWGVPGVVVALLLLGWLVPKGAHEQMKADRDEWRAAYEKERAGHEATRDALAEASKAAAAAVETARTTTALLSNLGHPAARPGTGG
jgi:hypothetical protein